MERTPPNRPASLPSLHTTAPGFATTGSVPAEGTVIAGKYRIVRLIGAGGMGVVVEGRVLNDSRRVAIKCLAREALDDTELLDRFSREARAFARIKSRHVVRILDTGIHEGRPFLVLEYLEGIDVARHLAERGPLPLGEAARHVVEACEALGEAHAANIIHRDIKPANLFLAEQPDGTTIIKVLDFGVSKLTDDPVTETRSVLGTVSYMSPEQLQSSKGVDHRTDIWALGALLYELLTGAMPFDGLDINEIVQSVRANKPSSLRARRPDLPDAIEEVIDKCLRSNADERYDSALALAAALMPFAEGLLPPAAEVEAPRSERAVERQTIIAEGTRFRGSLTSTFQLLVSGSVEGDVDAPSVTISVTGTTSGKIAAGALKSHGRIAGDCDVETAEIAGSVAHATVLRAASLDLKLTVPIGKLQLTFGPTRGARRIK